MDSPTEPCQVCGTQFVPRIKKGPTKQTVCGPRCRKTKQREYMRHYMRNRGSKERKIRRDDIKAWGDRAHIEARGLGIGNRRSDDEFDSRIDQTHDAWDFIPARVTLLRDPEGGEDIETKLPRFNAIGTVSGKDLSIINTKDGPRVLAAVRLEERRKLKMAEHKAVTAKNEKRRQEIVRTSMDAGQNIFRKTAAFQSLYFEHFLEAFESGVKKLDLINKNLVGINQKLKTLEKKIEAVGGDAA